ncbi:MAG: hypothetical protein ACW967_10530 [Candidatus Hodarchaeales archaeon]|jgi:hypothetical protein
MTKIDNFINEFVDRDLFTTAYRITVAIIINIVFWGAISIVLGFVILVPLDLIFSFAEIHFFEIRFLSEVTFLVFYLIAVISSFILLILLLFKEIKQIDTLYNKENG